MILNDSNDQNSKSGREMVYGPKDFCLEISPLDQGSTFLNNNNKLTQNWGMDRN